jgi:DNA-binding transcriptional MerR regulator
MAAKYLTVSDLAYACIPLDASDDYDPERAKLWTRRLRHWATLDIIPAAAKNRAGAGQHRLFDAETAYIAAILLRVAATGISISIIRDISTQIQDATKGKSQFAATWRVAVSGDDNKQYWLLINFLGEEKIDLAISEGDRPPVPLAELEPVILLNITHLFEMIRITLD